MKKNWLTIVFSCSLFNFLNAQTADFTFSSADTLHCSPYKVSFTQKCTGDPIGFLWNFGNNQRGGNSSETVVYDNPGTYSVTLTALYTNNAVSTTKTITIHPSPTVTLTPDRNYLCNPGVVNFTAAGSSFITRYEWNFGDSSIVQTTNSNNITASYREYGNFTPSVKAVTDFGCIAVSSADIAVSKFGIAATISTDSGCIPVMTNIGVTTSLPPGDKALNYSWNFGDGTPVSNITDSNSNHLYNTTDSITKATVVITTLLGCSNRFEFPAFAFGTPPTNTIAGTALLKDSFCASENIKFICRATNANSYKWEFGDSTETTTTDTLISYQYRSLGNKRIIITPFFNGCAGMKDTLNIFIKGVVANFSFTNSCGNKKNYQFKNASLGNITHFEWKFADNPGLKDSINFNPVHNFPAWGSFKTALLLVDNTTGCTDESGFNIYTAVPSFNSNINSVCKDSLITYRVIHSYADSGGYTYDFHVNGDTLNNGTDSVLNYHPATHGSFTDYVVIKDALTGTCDDTLQLSNNTIVKGPVADFEVPVRMCLDKAITITNNSYPFYPADIISTWEWEYGDGTKDSGKSPAPHKYSSPVYHTIVLKATDINGCGQIQEKAIFSDRLPQVFAFPAMDTICQAKDTVVLAGYTIDSLLWLPSTSISCNSCDTTLVYPASTTAYVAQATTLAGCRSYDTVIVKVYGPINLKVFPADTTVCPGQPVAFNLNTDGITLWNPAPTSSRGIKKPVISTAVNSSYTVIVKDSAGCYADTAVANINVFALPTVNAGADQVLPYGTAFTITPVYSHDAVSYLWEPFTDLNCTNCPFASGKALKTTSYTIKIVSADGCKASDNITIFVACEKSNLLLPTAFTPNGNGLNEYFYPIARGYKTIKRFVIFNRNGNKVFERKNFAPNIPSLGWDGIIQGAQNVSSTETFAWYAEAECDKGEVITSNGMVVLIR